LIYTYIYIEIYTYSPSIMYLVVGPFFEHIQTNIRNEYEYYEYKHIITHLAKAIDLIESSMYNVA